jgi:hypothetical protein
MKIKFNSLLAGALACFALVATSCSKDQNGDNGEIDGGNDDFGFFSLNIQDVTGNVLTRGAGDALFVDAGTSDESKLNALRVVLYNGAGVVTYSWDIDPTSIADGEMVEDGSSGNPSTTTQGREVVKADYHVLLLINPNQDAKDATDAGKTEADLWTSIDGTSAADFIEGTGGSQDNFMMGNWQELVELPQASIADSKAVAEATPIEIYVERTVAKIMVGIGADPAGSGAVEGDAGKTIAGLATDATVSDIKFVLDVLNKNTYLIRKKALAVTTPSANPAVAATLGNEYTQISQRHRHYATDPNFTGISTRDGAIAGGNIANNFAYATDGTITWNNITSPQTDYKNYTTGYVLENTMEADEQYRDVTTALLFQMVYAPNESSLDRTSGGGTTQAIGTGTPYFAYKNYVFTAADFDDVLSGTFTVTDASPADVRKFLAIDVLAELKTEMGISGTFAGNLPSASESFTFTEDNIDYTVQFFDANQINYYRAPIRHYDAAIQARSMAYGRFGVVRNNVYLLHLESVDGPGTAEIEYGGPDEEEYGYVSIKFEILPWVLREHGVSLGR